MCKSVQARRLQDIKEPISNRDMEFVSNVATYDRWKYQDKILDMKMKQILLHPSANIFSLCTSFDYTKVPVSITVGLPDAFRPESALDRAEYDATVKEVIESNGRFSLSHKLIPPSVILWAAKPEENVIEKLRFSKPPDGTTLWEQLDLTEEEFTLLTPQVLKYLGSNTK